MKQEIDFEIYTRGVENSENTLIVVDFSEYYERPSNVLMEATFPDIDKVYTSYVNPKTVTALTTKSFGYSGNKIPFPDGLYKLRLSVKPNEKSFKCTNYLKLDRIKNKLAELLQEDCIDKVKLDLIYDVDKYLTAATANQNKNPKVAVELYQEALKKLNKLNCQ